MSGPKASKSQSVGGGGRKRFEVLASREATLSDDLQTVVQRRLTGITLVDRRFVEDPSRWLMSREEMRLLRDALDTALVATAGDLEEGVDD
ncbi:hypothetical protein 7S3_42 [uncultured Caudovirales phage]|uniref:Uncharacterized protein n=1 Tax=uncultured Caudovirales phage TaxID=2100421 RepID=A0A2H4J2A6_9CAUD|nr:hypothetical protein 7S3_42 [uncultured Caudovirales phage]